MNKDMFDPAEYITQLCRRSGDDVEAIGKLAASRIRREVAAYRSVDQREHDSNVTAQLDALLTGLGSGRDPAADDLEQARALAGRRALQDLPIDAVIAAYHLGYQFMWTRLLGQAQDEGPEQALALVKVVENIWRWIETIVTAAAEGHAVALNERQAHQISAGHRLVEMLYAGRSTDQAASILARSAGFNPQGSFCVISYSSDSDSEDSRRAFEQHLRQQHLAMHTESRQDAVLAIVQSPGAAIGFDFLASLHLLAGVSSMTRGLTGLARLLGEADKSMEFARHSRTTPVLYPQRWSEVEHHAIRASIAPLIGNDASHRAPHVAQAVTAFVNNGFSVTAAGAALHVHPNTVRYRLDRWQALTGWNVRTLDGLQRSVANIALAPWPNSDATDALDTSPR